MHIEPKKPSWLKRMLIRYEKPIAIGIMVVAVAAVFSRVSLLNDLLETKVNDFYQYWTMGRMYLAQGNPYNPAEFLVELQRYYPEQSAGVYPFYFPWVVPILAPFGALPYSTAHLIWFVLSFAIVISSSFYAWKLYGGKSTRLWVMLLVIISFFPIIFSLFLGQATVFLLVGFAGFIYFIRKRQDFLAGVAIQFLLIKPNVVYLVLLSILVMVLVQKRWKVVAGGAVGLVVLLALSYAIHPRIFELYLQSMAQNPPTEVLGASLYGMISGLLNRQVTGLLYVPVAVGVIGCLAYIFKNNKQWDWSKHLNVPLILSILTTPYIWIHDEIILVFPIVYVVSLFAKTRPLNWFHYLLLVLYLLIDGLAIKFNGFIYPPHLFYWIPLSLSLIYVLADAAFHPKQQEPVTQPV